MQRVLEKYLKPRDEFQEVRLQLVRHYAEMYTHLYEWTDGDCRSEQAAESGQKMLLLYSELTVRNHTLGQCINRWRPFPKCHLLCHLLTDQVRHAGNPKDFWCYADESRIGEIARAAEKCHASHVQKSLMLRMRIDER